MSGVTAHVLDTTRGRPAAGVQVVLARMEPREGDPEVFVPITSALTNADGRVADLIAGVAPKAGIYRITFESGAYFAQRGLPTFYPRVEVLFQLTEPSQHYHIPLLLSPFGYSTYRGS